MVAGVISTRELRKKLLDESNEFVVSPMPPMNSIKLGAIDLSLGSIFLLEHHCLTGSTPTVRACMHTRIP
jgi:hypothetical protein